MFSHLRKLDWQLIFIVLLLSGVGLLTIYGIGSPESLTFFKKQLSFVCLGFIIMISLSFFDYRIFKNYSFVLIILYILSFLALFFVLFSQDIRGASSWFRIGFLRFEPIEFIKIVIVLILAKYFSSRHIEMYRVRHLIVSGIYIALLTLIIFLQPDLGSILVLLSIWFGIIIVSGIKVRHLIILILILSIISLKSLLFFIFSLILLHACITVV